MSLSVVIMTLSIVTLSLSIVTLSLSIVTLSLSKRDFFPIFNYQLRLTMKQYYVYILKCCDDSYYTGITNNIERRFAEHQEGINKTSYTFRRRPIELVFSMMFKDVRQAIAFEKQVKGWSRKKKEAIINNQWELLPELSRTSTNFKRE